MTLVTLRCGRMAAALPTMPCRLPRKTDQSCGSRRSTARRVHWFASMVRKCSSAPRQVPLTGSLFIVFRATSPEPAGQRLLGWEDSAVGQHGIGLLVDAGGSLHAVLRRNGTNGDVVAPTQGSQELQLVSLTWGPAGAKLYRNGAAVGTNQAIDAVSSDPEIRALCIGGAGSGAGPTFSGELAELRVYTTQFDEISRSRVEAELHDRWLAAVPADGSRNDSEADIFYELLSTRGPFWGNADERDQLLPDAVRQRLFELRTELETLKKKSTPDIPRRRRSGRGPSWHEACRIPGRPRFHPRQPSERRPCRAAWFSTSAGGGRATADSRGKRPP